MRYLGLDLGTTSLGIALTDKTNMIALPLKVLKFPKEEYAKVLPELKELINDNNITDIVLGLPKNMDNSLGFASQRSLNFAKLLEQFNLNIHLYDERLTTVEALNLLKQAGYKNLKEKKVDAIAAQIMLESFLKGLK